MNSIRIKQTVDNQKQFLSFALLYFSVFVVADWINHKFQLVDFEVYYRAAERLAHGEAIYRVEGDGHFVYKYSPIFAALFVPFTWLGIEVARFVFIGLLYVVCSATMVHLVRESKWLGILLLLIFLKHINKEVHLGQVNLILLGLLFFSYRAFYHHQYHKFGLLNSLSLFTKPVGLITIPFLLFEKKVRWITYWIFSILAMTIAVFVIFYRSWERFQADCHHWFSELQIELMSKKDLLFIDNHTLVSAIHKWTHFEPTICLTISILLLFLMAMKIHQKSDPYEKSYLIIGLIPLISCTSNNFYVLTIPMFFLLLRSFQTANLWIRIGIVMAALLMGGNIYEIWGRAGVDAIDRLSPYVASTLLAYLMLLYPFSKKIK